MSYRYGAIRDGEPFKIGLRQALLLQCCHCGLVHDMKFKVLREDLEIKMTQNARETKKARKKRKARA